MKKEPLDCKVLRENRELFEVALTGIHPFSNFYNTVIKLGITPEERPALNELICLVGVRCVMKRKFNFPLNSKVKKFLKNGLAAETGLLNRASPKTFTSIIDSQATSSKKSLFSKIISSIFINKDPQLVAWNQASEEFKEGKRYDGSLDEFIYGELGNWFDGIWTTAKQMAIGIVAIVAIVSAVAGMYFGCNKYNCGDKLSKTKTKVASWIPKKTLEEECQTFKNRIRIELEDRTRCSDFLK